MLVSSSIAFCYKLIIIIMLWGSVPRLWQFLSQPIKIKEQGLASDFGFKVIPHALNLR